MSHFTVWVTTDPSCLEGPYTDVTVIEDEIFGYRLDDNGDPDHTRPLWESSGEWVFNAPTTIRYNADHDVMLKHALEVLDTNGWIRDTPWQAVNSGYVATVIRKGEHQ